MKIEIESDVFDIVERIKSIDENYYILFDTDKDVYELHNKSQNCTFCFIYPYDLLDSRMIDLIYYSNVANIDKIMEDIDKNNKGVEYNCGKKIRDYGDYVFREIYKFANNSSKSFKNEEIFNFKWR